MATIAQIRDGLQDRLDTVTGVAAYDVATGNERMLDSAVALIFPRPGSKRATAGGARALRFAIEVHVPVLKTGLKRAQDILDALIDSGSGSIDYAIDQEPTLGGIVDYATVDPTDLFETYGFSTLNDTKTLMARLSVEVHAA